MSDYRQLTRRDFLRDGTLGAVAFGVATSASHTSQAAAEGGKSVVALVRDEKVMNDQLAVDEAVLRKMLDEAVKTATGESSAAAGWKKLFKPDDIVGLVPTKALNPTHEELVMAVTAALQEAGVPADRIQNVQGRKTEPVEKCTALICMPALKVHQLTGLGTVLKNYIAFSGKGSSFHQEKNGDLGSVWLMPVVKGKTRIVIVDALRPLFDRGPKPDPKYQWNYNGLLVGTDPVAVEATGLSIIMAKRKAYKGETWELTPPPLCVAAADKQYGLGTSDPARIALKISGWDKDLLISA
ncbi:DUF362 domain-containing protein [Candidatus Sumerlaeota bacterium]|nr:DUF362 domain-containing protein [Candidatus Sumerlaeota bacterium]